MPIYLSDVPGYTLGAYGNLIISKGIPFTKLNLTNLPTRLGRYAITGLFELRDPDLTLAICTSHLESYTNDTEYRKQQVTGIVSILNGYNCGLSVFMGDTNMKASNEDALLLSNSFVDTGITAGLTCDNRINSWTHNIIRIDRIYLRLKASLEVDFQPTVIGNVPKDLGNGKKIFPSDHFGLMLALKFNV